MSRPAQPVLTVLTNRSQVSFAPGRDVVVGSDVRADLRVTHPLVSRAHLLLRFDHGRWIAIDNNSRTGVFANGQRVPVVDIHDGQTITIGKPDGPRIAFAVGRHQGAVGLVPPTDLIPTIGPIMPSRWGYAASASTVDLRTLIPGTLSPKDSHWMHTPGAWLLDMGMLGALSVVYSTVVWWHIRLKR
jgi:FHA domain